MSRSVDTGNACLLEALLEDIESGTCVKRLPATSSLDLGDSRTDLDEFLELLNEIHRSNNGKCDRKEEINKINEESDEHSKDHPETQATYIV